MLKVNKINSNDVMKHKLKLGLSDRKICFRHTENFPNPVGLYNADGAEKFSYSFQTTIEDKNDTEMIQLGLNTTGIPINVIDKSILISATVLDANRNVKILGLRVVYFKDHESNNNQQSIEMKFSNLEVTAKGLYLTGELKKLIHIITDVPLEHLQIQDVNVTFKKNRNCEAVNINIDDLVQEFIKWFTPLEYYCILCDGNNALDSVIN